MSVTDDSCVKWPKHVALFGGEKGILWKFICYSRPVFLLVCSCIRAEYLSPRKRTKLYSYVPLRISCSLV